MKDPEAPISIQEAWEPEPETPSRILATRELARIGYGAYCRACPNYLRLPVWEELPERIKARWHAAARAIVRESAATILAGCAP